VRLFLAFDGGNAVQRCIERTLSSERKADKVKLFDWFRSAIRVKRAGCSIDKKLLEGGRCGWPIILTGLKTFLETGKTLPEFDFTK
jgi:hypothetical protein